MTWKLWIDDESFNPEAIVRHAPEGFKIAESSVGAMNLVLSFGFPAFVDFDHDLGGDDCIGNAKVEPDCAMKFLNQLRDCYDLHMIKPFDYSIHSQNPVGAKNIQAFMNSWSRAYENFLNQ